MSRRAHQRLWLAVSALLVVLAALVWSIAGRCASTPEPDTKASGNVPGDRASAGGVVRSRARAVPARPVPARLVGVVIDADGAPVESAAVRLRSLLSPPDRRDESRAETDRAGAFAFEDVLPGDYALGARAGDAASQPKQVHFDAASPPVVLRLSAAAGLEVEVVAATDAQPIPNARLTVIASSPLGDEVLRRATTDDTGRARVRGLQPGAYALVVEADGYRSRDHFMRPQAGLHWKERVELTRGAPVSGRVVDGTGAPVEGARVWPLPLASAAVVHLPEPKPWRPHATSGTDGTFEIGALDSASSGEWHLLAVHERYLPGTSEPFAVDGRSARAGIEIIVRRGRVLAGRVVDAQQTPRAGAVVRASEPRQTVPGSSVRSAIADEQGEFRLEGVPAGAIEVVAETSDASSETLHVDLSEADETGAILVLDVTARIAGRVVESDGSAIADAQVMCVGQTRGEAAGLRPIMPEATDADGYFACRGLPPGDYALTAMRPYPNNNQNPWMRSVNAPAAAGDEDVVLVLPADGAISGRLQLADGSTPPQFTVGVDSGGAPRPFAQTNGRFVLDGLAPRKYDVVIIAAGAMPHTVSDVQVPEGGTADLGTVVPGRND